MRIDKITNFISGPIVKKSRLVGQVIYVDGKRKRPKYLIKLPSGERVWWFVDKCRITHSSEMALDDAF